jgi:MFS family permease
MPAEMTRNARILATVGVALALFLAALDGTIVGIALPQIVADLNGLDYFAWVATSYLVTSTTLTPIAGKLGDLFGRKPFLLAGMIGFVLASALCGQAQNMAELVAFRGLQGIFGGVLFASVFATIGDLYSPAERAKLRGRSHDRRLPHRQPELAVGVLRERPSRHPCDRRCVHDASLGQALRFVA